MKQNTGNQEVTNLLPSRYIQNPYDCPVTRTMSFIGGKWKPIILYYLSQQTMRYGKLRMYIPAISSKMLTQELKELEQLGLIERKEFKEIPPRVEYSLTKKGKSSFSENLPSKTAESPFLKTGARSDPAELEK